MPLPTFAPPEPPSYPYSEPVKRPTESMTTHQGFDQRRAKAPQGLREVGLVWPDCSPANREYILDFFHRLEGEPGPFWWTPLDPFPGPAAGGPELSDGPGGSEPAATYYAQFTYWHTTYGESTPSPEESHQVLLVNRQLRVKVPPIPPFVTGWRVYASTTSGATKLQADVTTGRTWEQSGPLSTGGASPPTQNTLIYPRKWNLIDERPQSTRNRFGRWRMSLSLAEQII